jgi:prophage DNA circulation protein
MKKLILDEAIGIMNLVLNDLLNTLNGQIGTVAEQTRYLCGALTADGASELNAGGPQFWTDFANCFEAARQAGATFQTMDVVRSDAEAQSPTGYAGVEVRNFAVRMALVEQSRILAATTFTNRQDIDNYFNQINASFDAAELVAADNQDNVAYQALINLHAAVSNDLATRSRPLPRMVTYTFPNSMPSLYIAQRIYADPSRNDEIVAENQPIHPLFMSQTISVLSN